MKIVRNKTLDTFFDNANRVRGVYIKEKDTLYINPDYSDKIKKSSIDDMKGFIKQNKGKDFHCFLNEL